MSGAGFQGTGVNWQAICTVIDHRIWIGRGERKYADDAQALGYASQCCVMNMRVLDAGPASLHFNKDPSLTSSFKRTSPRPRIPGHSSTATDSPPAGGQVLG